MMFDVTTLNSICAKLCRPSFVIFFIKTWTGNRPEELQRSYLLLQRKQIEGM